MGTLATIHPRWIRNDGEDSAPATHENVPAHVILSRLAVIIDTADDMVERGSIGADERDDVARSIATRVLTMAHREPRALHTWWHGDMVAGETARHAAAPDVHERVRARTRVTRSNSGRTVNMVTVHGRAYVIGRTDDVRPHREHSMNAPRAAAMLDDVPRAAVGRDAVAVYHATQSLYGDSIPRLIGADVLTFHEFRSWDDVRSATPRRGHATRYRLPAVRARATDDVRPSERIAPCDHDVERENVPAVIERDERGRVIGKTHARVRTLTVPARHAFMGHRVIERGATYRDQRAQRARRIDDALVVRPGDDLAHVLASVAAAVTAGDAYRATWEHGAMSGTLTVSASGQFNVRGLPGATQVKARTVPALERAIARAQ